MARRFADGHLVAWRFRGVEFRVHWSTPMLAVLAGGFAYRPIVWGCVLATIVWHELGHAVFARAHKAEVYSIDVAGWGGVCRYRAELPPLAHGVIAWGGVVFQLALAALAFGYFAWRPPTSHAAAEVEAALVFANLKLAAVNLIPLAPLDGHRAWRALGPWWRKRRTHRHAAREENRRRLEAEAQTERAIQDALRDVQMAHRQHSNTDGKAT